MPCEHALGFNMGFEGFAGFANIPRQRDREGRHALLPAAGAHLRQVPGVAAEHVALSKQLSQTQTLVLHVGLVVPSLPQQSSASIVSAQTRGCTYVFIHSESNPKS